MIEFKKSNKVTKVSLTLSIVQHKKHTKLVNAHLVNVEIFLNKRLV